jgi:hypothetical protein
MPRRASHVEPRSLAAEAEIEWLEAQSGFGRKFGFLAHDISRLIKRRLERRARQMGLPVTRQQAAVVLNIAGNEGVTKPGSRLGLASSRSPWCGCSTSFMR